MIGFLIAILSGALMSVQGVFNTNVTKTAGLWPTNMFVQFSALAVCVGAWIATDRKNGLRDVFAVEPKYMLLGGVFGAMITLTVIKSMELLGPAKAVMIIVVAQLAMAYVIELLGLFQVDRQPFEWKKVLGMALAVLGIIMFKYH